MKLPALEGLVRRRLLVNFRVRPAVIERQLPAPFRPKLVGEWAMAGICLIRLEQLRPRGLPAILGVSSENGAHRIAVTWTDSTGETREGVYIPRRDTGSLFNAVAGGRLFPGEAHHARFHVRDNLSAVDLTMRTNDGGGDVRLRVRASAGLPSTSCFASLDAASSFFAAGSVGYSATSDAARLDGLRLHTQAWSVQTMDIDDVYSRYYADTSRFPAGSVEYDSTLVMRDIPHLWEPQPEPGKLGRDGAVAIGA